MGRALLLCLTLSALSGCAALNYPLPKCDGYTKRPLNRSMWDRDADKAPATGQKFSLSDKSASELAYADHLHKVTHITVAFTELNEASSHTDCRAG